MRDPAWDINTGLHGLKLTSSQFKCRLNLVRDDIIELTFSGLDSAHVVRLLVVGYAM